MLVKAGSILASLFSVFLVIDMILPRQLSFDTLMKKEAEHYYTGTANRQQHHHDISFRGSRFRFDVDMIVFNAFSEGDTISIYNTPIFKKPMEILFIQDNQTVTRSVAHTWPLWCIILTAFIAFSTYVNRHYETRTAMKAGIAAMVAAVALIVMSF